MSTLELFTTDWRELWQGAARQEPGGAIFTRPQIADISLPSLVSARGLIRSRLIGAACPEERAEELAAQWTIHTDFLLHDWGQSFSLVVGNPPYVRLEDLPKAVLEHYRR